MSASNEAARVEPATLVDHGGLLMAEDVADILGVPRAFVYELARRGDLPAVRIGERYIRFRLTAVERWIVEHETTAEARRRGVR